MWSTIAIASEVTWLDHPHLGNALGELQRLAGVDLMTASRRRSPGSSWFP